MDKQEMKAILWNHDIHIEPEELEVKITEKLCDCDGGILISGLSAVADMALYPDSDPYTAMSVNKLTIPIRGGSTRVVGVCEECGQVYNIFLGK